MLTLLAIFLSLGLEAHELDGGWDFSKDCNETGYHYTGHLELTVAGRSTREGKVEGLLTWREAISKGQHTTITAKSEMNGSLVGSTLIMHRRDLAPATCIATFTGLWKRGDSKVIGTWKNEDPCGNRHTGPFVLTRESSVDAKQSNSTVDFGIPPLKPSGKIFPLVVPGTGEQQTHGKLQ